MRILIVLPHPLLPLDGGNKYHTLNFLRYISLHHDCHVIGFHESGTRVMPPPAEAGGAGPLPQFGIEAIPQIARPIAIRRRALRYVSAGGVEDALLISPLRSHRFGRVLTGGGIEKKVDDD